MSEKKKLVLIGGGGHCRSVLDVVLRLNTFDEIVITDHSIPAGTQIMGCEIVGGDGLLPRLYEEGFRYAFITVGSIGDTVLRRKLCQNALETGFLFPNIVDPSAAVAADAEPGTGIFVGKQAVINAGAVIGDMAIINTGAIVEHDCRIGGFSHISVGATLCGGASVGSGVFIGAHATVVQGVVIGRDSTIGAGALVLGDVPNETKVVGKWRALRRSPLAAGAFESEEKKVNDISNRILIIAEAGVNHNGSLELAYRMVDAAKEAGADIVKFQTAKPEQMVSKFAGKAEYQKKTTGGEESQIDMLRRLLPGQDDFICLKKYCETKEIEFLSTPFDIESIRFLDELGCRFWKIPSGEITNYPYLMEIARTKKPVVLSTGMADTDEISAAVSLLREHGAGEICLLHCTTEYPAPFGEVNLRAMQTMKESFGCRVGYSDHTPGIEISVAAAALGAAVIEKHFTLDRNMEGPDHKASLEPDELAALVRAVRHVESALGNGIKRPTDSEKKNIVAARKSIVARRPIRKGETLTVENITTKRPGNGISPMRWNEVIGSKAIRDFEEDELLEV